MSGSWLKQKNEKINLYKLLECFSFPLSDHKMDSVIDWLVDTLRDQAAAESDALLFCHWPDQNYWSGGQSLSHVQLNINCAEIGNWEPIHLIPYKVWKASLAGFSQSLCLDVWLQLSWIWRRFIRFGKHPGIFFFPFRCYKEEGTHCNLIPSLKYTVLGRGFSPLPGVETLWSMFLKRSLLFTTFVGNWF